MATKHVNIKFNDLPKLIQEVPDKVDKAIKALAYEGEAYVKRSFTVSPSAPGEFPGVDTGTLKNSIHVKKRRLMLYALLAGTDYAIHLEYGTTRMAARPFFGPTVHWLNGEVPRVFKDFLE